MFVELHNTGDATIRTEVQVIIEHVLSDRPGEWRVSIVGSRAKEDWEMKVEGPNGFERSYTLVGTVGEHQPAAIGNLLLSCCHRRRHKHRLRGHVWRIVFRQELIAELFDEES